MTAEEILKENLIAVDTSSFKEAHYTVIENAMQEYAAQEIKSLTPPDAVEEKTDDKDFRCVDVLNRRCDCKKEEDCIYSDKSSSPQH